MYHLMAITAWWSWLKEKNKNWILTPKAHSTIVCGSQDKCLATLRAVHKTNLIIYTWLWTVYCNTAINNVKVTDTAAET